MPGPTLTIDEASEPGAWAKALRTPCSYRTISEHPGDTHPFPRRRETDGATIPQMVAPVLQETPAPLFPTADNPGCREAHFASVGASACGHPVSITSALKDGNGAFHGETNA